jgi:hypothetical protein
MRVLWVIVAAVRIGYMVFNDSLIEGTVDNHEKPQAVSWP